MTETQTPKSRESAVPDQPDVYVRRATGLVRAFSWTDMLVLNAFGTNIGIVLALTVLTGASLFPGSNMALAVILGMILCVFNGLTYGLMSVAMPRSGGEFVWLSYTVHPLVGFATNWGLVIVFCFAYGMYAGMTANFGFAATFASLGVTMNLPWLVGWATTVATPNWVFGLGTLFILISIVIFILGPKAIRTFLWVVFVPSMLGTIASLAVFLGTSHEAFVSTFNTVIQPYTNSTNSYQFIINAAKGAGASFPTMALVPTLMALPLGYWAFVGFANSAYVGGEVKTPGRTQPLAIMGTLLLSGAVYAVMFWKFYDVVGWDFTTAVAYLYYSAPSQYPLPSPPVLNFFVGLVTANPYVSLLIGISFILWTFMLVGLGPLIPSRCMFTWSFARITPEALAKVDKRGSPWVTVVVSGLIAELFLYLFTYTNMLDLVNYTIIWAIIFFIGGISAILLPYTKKSLFDASPGIVKKKIAGFPLLVIVGIMNEVLFGFIIYFSIINPAFSGPTGASAYGMIATIFLSGIVVYIISHYVRKRQGIDLALVWKEVPPE
jgi:amino acid transporter